MLMAGAVIFIGLACIDFLEIRRDMRAVAAASNVPGRLTFIPESVESSIGRAIFIAVLQWPFAAAILLVLYSCVTFGIAHAMAFFRFLQLWEKN